MLMTVAGLHASAALNPLDSASLPASFGAFGLFAAVFAETGLLIGFLPGQSVPFTAGLLCTTAATNKIHPSLPVLAAALLGAQTALGSTIPGLEQYLVDVVAVIAVVSVIAIALERRRTRRDGGRHTDRRYTLTEEDNPRW